MTYRTKTYLAAAWDEDKDAIEQLLKWNENNHFSLDFNDVHKYIQARDSSLECSIKASLSKRMDICKLFVLIVSDKTNTVKKGACMYCKLYSFYKHKCLINKNANNKSFVEFECNRASRDYYKGEIKILVLYNSSCINKYLCPESVRNIGKHVAMKSKDKYDYLKIKTAFDLLL